MGRFLAAAYRVLIEVQEPLSPRELTKIAVERGWLETVGKTPWQTMKSKLSTDVLRGRNRSCFMRTQQGKFGLREWQSQVQEYVADRYQRALLDEEVVVFPADSLSKYIQGVGLCAAILSNGRELLLECRPMLRRLAEADLSVIQLVSVFVLRFEKRYLTYKRTKRLPENRLHGEYSIIFGGHLNPTDIPTLFDIFQPAIGSTFLSRELAEEVRFPREEAPSIRYKGILYDDSRTLSKQHLGIAYDVFLTSERYEIGERGFLIDSRFETLEEIELRINRFENWSRIIIQNEKESHGR